MSVGALAAVASAMFGYYRTLDKYRVTNHGRNPWTNEAIANVVVRRTHFDHAIKSIDATLNSCYRSPRVNAIVGGVATSYHMRGLACDLRPGGIFAGEVGKAAYHLWEMATRGDLGPVRKICWEPTWVHISWVAPGEQAPSQPPLLKTDGKKPDGKFRWKTLEREVA